MLSAIRLEGRRGTMEKREPLCRLTGRVVHGKGLGRTVDMPTANLLPDPGQQLPPAGVYATAVAVAGKTYPGVTNVGVRPTVDREAAVTVETFILGLHQDLYGREMAVTFWHYLRPTVKMESLEAVKGQVRRDSLRTLELLGEHPAL